MRVISSIPHPSITITILQMNDKFIVRFEAGPMEQIFKFNRSEFNDLNSLKEKIDENFIEEVRIRFNEMYKQFG